MDKKKCLFPANGFRAKPHYAVLVFATAALMIALGSCKKQATPTADAAQSRVDSKTNLISGGLTDEQIDAMVTQFYDEVSNLKKQTSSADNISIAEAVLNIEAVYNKYVVVTNYLDDIASGELSFNLPANHNGSVNMKEAANVFWAIKEALLAKQSDLTENNVVPKLESFDLEAETDADGNPEQANGNYALKVRYTFAPPNGGVNPVQAANIFTDAATHCWKAAGATDGSWPSSGQGTIDHPNMTIVLSSIDLTKPSAPTALRTKGIYNYKAAYSPDLTGYAYNITTVGGNANTNITLPVMPAVNCDYVTRGIADYNNARYWNTNVYPNSYGDPYVIYKNWLTTPMMNYYVAAIKDVIQLNIAPGKYFYDFQIIQNVWFPPQVYTTYIHDYYISSCRYLRFVPAPLGLSEL